MWLLLGIALICLALLDALWTTLWVDGGAGPLTARLTTWAWKGLLALVGHRHHQALSLFGPIVITAVVTVWVVLLWAGWVFVFASEPGALVSTQDYRTAPDWAGRIFYVAYSMFTMGNGDFAPRGGVWQILSSLTTATGFFLASMVISYILSVLVAVVAKRGFASQVVGMGGTAEEFLKNAWNGKDFHTLDLGLSTLGSDLSKLTEQYLSYPVLQYYHAERMSKAPSVAMVILDDALTLLRFGIPEANRPNVAVLRSAHMGVEGFLESLPNAFIHAAEDHPPPPDLEALRRAGIPTVADEEFARALEGLRERRRKLLGLLRNDGWNWSDL